MSGSDLPVRSHVNSWQFLPVVNAVRVASSGMHVTKEARALNVAAIP